MNIHIQFRDHDAGGPFGKNLMQHLTEEEIQEIEARTVVHIMDMESDEDAVGQVYTNLKPAVRRYSFPMLLLWCKFVLLV